jgi:hypothetical protein
VEASIEKAKLKSLKKVGFKTREAAMNSIKDGTGYSHPGEPPISHTGVLRRFILYSMGDGNSSVVIGPKYLKKKSRDAAAALERGGIATNSRGRVIRVEQRPFMVPAFERVNRENVPAVFANSVQ